SFSFTVEVKDSTGVFSPASASQSITISAATASVALTTPSNGGTVRQGNAINGTLSTNLTSPAWSFVNTPTPSGQPALTLTPSGSSFSGTAPAVTQSTSYSIVGTATGASGYALGASAVSVTVKPALAISGGPSG